MWGMLAASLFLLPFNLMLASLLLACALGLAIFYGVVTPPAMVFMLVMLTATLLSHKYRQKSKWLTSGSELLLVIGAAALFLHLVPGFNNLKLLDKIYVGALSAPFTMYYNFDKALIPFLLLPCLPSLFITDSYKTVSKMAWYILILCIPALLLLAVMFGGLKVEFHVPAWTGSFVVANLFFVCITEEALFRGYLQQRLSQRLGVWPALIISVLLFGACHYAGGFLLMLFATLAGVIYGLAWMWSGRLWVAVLFHFSLNMLHLLFFTYPFYLVR